MFKRKSFSFRIKIVFTKQFINNKYFKSRHGHNKTFGGKTIYGLLIDAACKNYGWTKEYAVWGIDVISLRLMLADSINSVYLSDEDLKHLHIPSGDVLDAGNAENTAEILAMNWD